MQYTLNYDLAQNSLAIVAGSILNSAG